MIKSIRPAVDDVKDISGDRTSKNAQFVREVTVANVRRTVANIREKSPILRELETSGKLKIVGALQDISTGEVTILN